MLAKTRLYSILHNRCPRCHEGKFFESDNAYQFPGFDKMNTKCSECGEDFEREPGFYYGAMYVNYGLTVMLGLAVFITYFLIAEINMWIFGGILGLLLALLIPVYFRWSRLIYVNLFVGYKDPQERKK